MKNSNHDGLTFTEFTYSKSGSIYEPLKITSIVSDGKQQIEIFLNQSLFSEDQANKIKEEDKTRKFGPASEFLKVPIEINGKSYVITHSGWNWDKYIFYLKNRMANKFHHQKKHKLKNG